MLFIESVMLFFLSACAIPPLIHLLNRMRYQTVYWAATFFLSKAFRKSTRIARMKEILILLCRIFAIAAIAIAFSRPLADNFKNFSFFSESDKIFIILDRSPSMSVQNSQGTTRLSIALNYLYDAFSKFNPAPPYLLIDNSSEEFKEIKFVKNLLESEIARANSTLSSIPDMLSKTFDYISENKITSAQIWILSDGQKSDWQQNSNLWNELHAKFASRKISTEIFLIHTPPVTDPTNISLLPKYLRRDFINDNKFELCLNVNTEQISNTRIPLSITTKSGASTIYVNIDAKENNLKIPFEINADEKNSWAKIQIPSDKTEFDNTVFVALGKPAPINIGILSDDNYLIKSISSAVNPNNKDNISVMALSDLEFETDFLNSFDILFIELPLRNSQSSFTKLLLSGKTIVLFPAQNAEDTIAVTKKFHLKNPENAKGKEYFALSNFISASIQIPDQLNLVLPFANFAKRFEINGDFTPILKFSDGKAFLAYIGNASTSAYVFSASLSKENSNFTANPFFPIFVRSIAINAADKKANFQNMFAAPIKSLSIAGIKKIEGTDSIIPYTNAGIYAQGENMVAVNPSPSEYENEYLSANDFKNLLNGKISIGALDINNSASLKEVWKEFLLIALVLMLLEHYLCLSFSTLPNTKKSS